MDGVDKPVGSNESNASLASKFASPGILLFLDQLIIAAGGWIYWLVISGIATTSEVGQSTTVYSLVLLVNTVIQLGLEYPLLRRSATQRSRIFWTVIAIELILTAVSIPIILYVISNSYQELQYLSWLAIGILAFSSVAFVARFALLGLSNSRSILIFDFISTIVKLAAGFILVSIGYGVVGILLSFLLQSIVIVTGTMYASKKAFAFVLSDIIFAKEIIKDGLVNMPSKFSHLLLVSLSVVLLALFGADSSEIGVFYISIMISIVAASFASSLAFMSIPASSLARFDFSFDSLRFGLSFTSPIIVILIVAPEPILSVVGTEYVAAANYLGILSAGIFPSIILSNAISRFNNLNESKKILVLGLVRLILFLAAFFIMVPQYGVLGAAYSILVSFTLSSTLSMAWSDKTLIKFTIFSLVSIIIGIVSGFIVKALIPEQSLATILTSLAASITVIFLLKCISIKEIKIIIESMKR